MAQHVTVVYYANDNLHPDLFYVMDINNEKLQKAFDEHAIESIKCITVELEHLTIKDAKTFFTEKEITHFLDSWNIKYIKNTSKQ